jgi:hypothetical protein
MKETLIRLSQAPATQIDPVFAARLAQVARTGYSATDMKYLLDMARSHSLCNDAALRVLEQAWVERLREETPF